MTDKPKQTNIQMPNGDNTVDNNPSNTNDGELKAGQNKPETKDDVRTKFNDMMDRMDKVNNDNTEDENDEEKF